MKTTTNKKELKALSACLEGYETFVEAHGDNDATLSQCLDSNGWNDVWWLIEVTYDQFSDEQKHDLCVYGCKKALINIEKIKPYCSEDDYKLIVDYLNNPTESAWSAAESAAESAARSAWSAVESAAESSVRSAAESAWLAARSAAWSTAWSAAESAESAARSAWSAELASSAASSAARSAELAELAAMKEFTKELRELFIKWEGEENKEGL